MCLSLEYQNPSKISEKIGYFDRVTVSLHIYIPQTNFKMANSKVDLGQIKSEEIVYSRFMKIPLANSLRSRRRKG